MKKIILGLGAAVGLSAAVVAIAAPAGLVHVTAEKTTSSLAVKLVATANQAEEAAFVALGSDAAAVAAAAGDRPAVAGEGAARSGQGTQAAARDAAASEDVIALIVLAIENDVKAQVAAGVPTLSIATALTRASNTPNLSRNVAAAFGRVQHDLSDLFDQGAPGSINGRRGINPFAASTEMAVGGPARRIVSNGSTGGGSDDGASGGGADDGGSTGGGADDGSSGGGSTGGGSDDGSSGGGSTDGGSDDGSTVPSPPTDTSGGSGYRPG